MLNFLQESGGRRGLAVAHWTQSQGSRDRYCSGESFIKFLELMKNLFGTNFLYLDRIPRYICLVLAERAINDIKIIRYSAHWHKNRSARHLILHKIV